MVISNLKPFCGRLSYLLPGLSSPHIMYWQASFGLGISWRSPSWEATLWGVKDVATCAKSDHQDQPEGQNGIPNYTDSGRRCYHRSSLSSFERANQVIGWMGAMVSASMAGLGLRCKNQIVEQTTGPRAQTSMLHGSWFDVPIRNSGFFCGSLVCSSYASVLHWHGMTGQDDDGVATTQTTISVVMVLELGYLYVWGKNESTNLFRHITTPNISQESHQHSTIPVVTWSDFTLFQRRLRTRVLTRKCQ